MRVIWQSEECLKSLKKPNDINALTFLGLVKLWKGDIDGSQIYFKSFINISTRMKIYLIRK